MAESSTAAQQAAAAAAERQIAVEFQADFPKSYDWTDLTDDVLRATGTMAAVNPWKSPGALGRSVSNQVTVTLQAIFAEMR